MTRYAKGRRAEWKTRDLLARQGYTVVRAAGSKGAFDLIAWSRTLALLVQVKAGRPPGPAERARILAVPVPGNFRRVGCVWRTRARDPEWYEVAQDATLTFRALPI